MIKRVLSFYNNISYFRTMAKHHTINGYEEFTKFIENLNKDEVYYFLYTGSKTDDGKSWCPDCVEADPVIESAVAKAPESAHFVTVYVGDRETWKDRHCSFRNDPNTKLLVIPTLVRWKGPQRLEGEKCAKKELVEMLFTEDED